MSRLSLAILHVAALSHVVALGIHRSRSPESVTQTASSARSGDVDGHHQAVVFMDWTGTGTGDWSTITAKSAMTFNPGVPVYVVTDTAEAMAKDMRAECPSASESQFHVLSLGRFQNKDRREKTFMKDYVHSSMNPIDYERNCFRRFFWLRQFMKTTGVKHALFADSDILFLENVFRLYGLTETLPFFALSDKSTFFSYWSEKTLNDFCNFIYKFYKRPKQNILADIQKYGLHRPLALIQTETPWIHQFSDMWIFTAFLDHRSDLQAHVRFPGHHPTQIWKPLSVLHGLHDKTGSCYTNDNMTSADFRWLEVDDMHNRYLMPIVGGTRPPALHFQGHCKQSIVGAAKRIGIPCPAR